MPASYYKEEKCERKSFTFADTHPPFIASSGLKIVRLTDYPYAY
jgi:hypothetical protein